MFNPLLNLWRAYNNEGTWLRVFFIILAFTVWWVKQFDGLRKEELVYVTEKMGAACQEAIRQVMGGNEDGGKYLIERTAAAADATDSRGSGGGGRTRRDPTVFKAKSKLLNWAPYMVAIGENQFPLTYHRGRYEIPRTRCSGTILTKYWVLTVGHCRWEGTGWWDGWWPTIPSWPTTLWITAGTPCLPDMGGLRDPAAQAIPAAYYYEYDPHPYRWYHKIPYLPIWNEAHEALEELESLTHHQMRTDFANNLLLLLLADPIQLAAEPWRPTVAGEPPAYPAPNAALRLPDGPERTFKPGERYRMSAFGASHGDMFPILLQSADMLYEHQDQRMLEHARNFVGYDKLRAMTDSEARRWFEETHEVYWAPRYKVDTQGCGGDYGAAWLQLVNTPSGEPELVGIYVLNVNFAAPFEHRMTGTSHQCGDGHVDWAIALNPTRTAWLRETVNYYSYRSDREEL